MKTEQRHDAAFHGDASASQREANPNPFSTLAGGEKITVALLAGGQGTTEEVFVKELAVKELPELLEAMKSENVWIEKAMVYTGKPAQWAESLQRQSLKALVKKGDELNLDFFREWQQDVKANAELLPKRDPAEILMLLEVLQKSNPGLLEQIMSNAGANAGSLNMSPTSRTQPALRPVAPEAILSPS